MFHSQRLYPEFNGPTCVGSYYDYVCSYHISTGFFLWACRFYLRLATCAASATTMLLGLHICRPHDIFHWLFKYTKIWRAVFWMWMGVTLNLQLSVSPVSGPLSWQNMELALDIHSRCHSVCKSESFQFAVTIFLCPSTEWNFRPDWQH